MANAVYTRYLGDIRRDYIEILGSFGFDGTSWTAVRRRPFDDVGLRHHLEPLIIEEHKFQVRNSIDSTSQPPRLAVPPPMLTPPILYLTQRCYVILWHYTHHYIPSKLPN